MVVGELISQQSGEPQLVSRKWLASRSLLTPGLRHWALRFPSPPSEGRLAALSSQRPAQQPLWV